MYKRQIFARFEAQKFGRDDGENADTAVSRALGCDLLILDDLGTELMTSFVPVSYTHLDVYKRQR